MEQHNLTLAQFIERLNSAKQGVANALLAVEQVILLATSVWRRQGNLTEEAKALGISTDEATKWSVVGFILDAIEANGGILTSDGDVPPSWFADHVDKAMGAAGGVSATIYRPINTYVAVCVATGEVPTMAGIKEVLVKSLPKKETDPADVRLYDDLVSVYNRIVGQTKKGASRTPVTVNDDAKQMIRALNDFVSSAEALV